MRVDQLEVICQLAGISPCLLFEDSIKPEDGSELILALKDKIDLQKDIINLLREQLADCKEKIANQIKNQSN